MVRGGITKKNCIGIEKRENGNKMYGCSVRIVIIDSKMDSKENTSRSPKRQQYE